MTIDIIYRNNIMTIDIYKNIFVVVGENSNFNTKIYRSKSSTISVSPSRCREFTNNDR